MAIVPVLALVDWTAQVRNARAGAITDNKRRATITLAAVARAIIATLEVMAGPRERFQVRLRLYHGWHRGPAPTEMRKAMLELENDPEFTIQGSCSVSFLLPLEYGERLMAALPHRLTTPSNARLPSIHLPDTYRPPTADGKEWREKMVDTALACDILVHARSDPADWRIVLAEDDDLVPALFTAEAWSKGRGGRTILIRKRERNKHLMLDGLLKEYAA